MFYNRTIYSKEIPNKFQMEVRSKWETKYLKILLRGIKSSFRITCDFFGSLKIRILDLARYFIDF